MFPKGLIVSSQALEGNPLRDSEVLAIMAQAAELGGAQAIRANGVEDITAMRKRVTIPIIGINKMKDETGRTVITPDFAGAEAIAKAGADIIALDATFYHSNIREDSKELIKDIHDKLHLQVMADISTAEEAYHAAQIGADAVSTTLAGYIPGQLHTSGELYTPNFDLIQEILNMKLPVSLIAEGRFWKRADLKKAFMMGVDGIVIGKAITNPMAITRYFAAYMEEEI